MKKFRRNLITGCIALTCGVTTVSAQVTIGQDKSPEAFSVLELISNNTMGLRLPQLTTQQRNDLQATPAFQAEATGKARGLQMFNTDTKCVETWNGTTWVSVCAMCGDKPCIYYPPSNLITPNGNITTFVNVMYDFQHQTIEAYNFIATPVSYQWYAKRKGDADTAYKGISGATAITSPRLPILSKIFGSRLFLKVMKITKATRLPLFALQNMMTAHTKNLLK